MIINNYSILKELLSTYWVHSERLFTSSKGELGGENYPQALMVLVPKFPKICKAACLAGSWALILLHMSLLKQSASGQWSPTGRGEPVCFRTGACLQRVFNGADALEKYVQLWSVWWLSVKAPADLSLISRATLRGGMRHLTPVRHLASHAHAHTQAQHTHTT